MKKVLAVLFVSGLILLGSCVQKTCPAYSKKIEKTAKQELPG
jgi:hypothetical protein